MASKKTSTADLDQARRGLSPEDKSLLQNMNSTPDMGFSAGWPDPRTTESSSRGVGTTSYGAVGTEMPRIKREIKVEEPLFTEDDEENIFTLSTRSKKPAEIPRPEETRGQSESSNSQQQMIGVTVNSSREITLFKGTKHSSDVTFTPGPTVSEWLSALESYFLEARITTSKDKINTLYNYYTTLIIPARKKVTPAS